MMQESARTIRTDAPDAKAHPWHQPKRSWLAGLRKGSIAQIAAAMGIGIVGAMLSIAVCRALDVLAGGNQMETSFDMFPEPKQPGPGSGQWGWIIIAIAVALAIIILSVSLESKAAYAYTGRKAIVYTRGKVMLAENAPWVLGKTDCSERVWQMIRDLWPELTVTKWFHRDRAAAMAGWPWPPLMSLDRAMFGDLLFANAEEYPSAKTHNPVGAGLKPARSNRPAHADFAINHVLLHWVRPETAVHASKKRGFSETNLRPYWRPRITVAIRPPYQEGERKREKENAIRGGMFLKTHPSPDPTPKNFHYVGQAFQPAMRDPELKGKQRQAGMPAPQDRGNRGDLMPALIPFLLKIVWWLLPKVATKAVDVFGDCLGAVEQANTDYPTGAERRVAVMLKIKEISGLPDAAIRCLVELCVLLNRLCIKKSHFDKMEGLLAMTDLRNLTDDQRRGEVLRKFLELYPGIPEYVARLLIQVASIKLGLGSKESA